MTRPKAPTHPRATVVVSRGSAVGPSRFRHLSPGCLPGNKQSRRPLDKGRAVLPSPSISLIVQNESYELLGINLGDLFLGEQSLIIRCLHEISSTPFGAFPCEAEFPEGRPIGGVNSGGG